MTAPLAQQKVVALGSFDPRVALREFVVELLGRCSVYMQHVIDDAELGDDRAVIDDFARALSCFRAAAETVRELRAAIEQERAA